MAATYTPIASIVCGVTTQNVTFSNIPQTYSDLVILSNIRISGTSGEGTLLIFNSDSTTLYSYTRLYTNQSSVVSDRTTGNGSIDFSYSVGNDAAANLFTPSTIDIINYTSTTNFKSLFSRWYNPQTNQHEGFNACLYRSTNAISSITLYPAGSKSFIAGTTFDMFGILGANA